MNRFFTKNILLIISLLILISSSLFLIKFIPSKRDRYEAFLSQELKKVPAFSKKQLNEIPKPDRPDLAAYQNYFMIIDPQLKYVPTERLYAAYGQMKSATYKSLNTSITWQEQAANMGGRTRAIMYDPNDATKKKVWAGGVTGGLWYNNDITLATSSWIPVGDFWESLAVSCITYDPTNTQIMYVGTGEAQTAVTTYRESSGLGMGIWKSTNGGTTWNLLPSTQDFKFITDIKVRNENGTSVIYAGVVSGLYHGIQSSSPTDGLYRSSNGGTTWQQVLPNITGKTVPYAPADIEINSTGTRIYVGSMRNLNGDGGGTILYSNTGILGSWTKYETYKTTIEADPTYNLPGRVILAAAPQAKDSSIIYALYSAGSNTQLLQGFGTYIGRYILRSNDKGVSWTQKNIPANYDEKNWAYLAWHAFTAAVSPTNPDTVFIGALDVHRSANGGSSWTKISDWKAMYSGGGTDYVHADIHTFVFKPGSSRQFLVGTDGGVFYTSTKGTAFYERNKNYNTLQYYTCAIDYDATRNILIGGLQDNGTIFYQGSPVTIDDMFNGGDGSYCFFDKNDPYTYLTSVYQNSYLFYYNNGADYSTYDDASGTFTCPADYNADLGQLYANAASFEGNHLNKLVRITGIPSSPTGTKLTLNTSSAVPYSCVKLSPYSPTNTSTLFIGTMSGKLFKVTHAEATPQVTNITGSNFPTANISSVAIGGSEDTLLVTFSNYGVASVFQSYNGGGSWENKEGNLPDMPIRWAIYHPQNSHQAMLATELGIFTTTNLHQASVIWTQANQGLANVRIDMLSIRELDNTVLAATHGRGMYTATYPLDFTVPSGNLTIESSLSNFKVFPNPANEKIYVSFDTREHIKGSLRILDIQGKVLYEDKLISLDKQYAKVIDLSTFPKGTYFISIIQGDKMFVKKLIHN